MLNKVYCLQFCSYNQNYFLPSICMVESLLFSCLKKNRIQPIWLEGFFHWRDFWVPIINLHLEPIQKLSKKNECNRVLLLYSLSEAADMPYIGTVISEIPRSMTIEASDFAFTQTAEDNDFIYNIRSSKQEGTVIDLSQLSVKVHQSLFG